MTETTLLHDAPAWSPPGIKTVGVAVGSVPRRPGEPAFGRSNPSRGERPLSHGIPASARENRGRRRPTARPAISSRARDTRGLPTRWGAAHSGEGDLPRLVETKDAAHLREALRGARRAIGDSRTTSTEGAGTADRALPIARRESRAGRQAIRRWEIRPLDRDGSGPGIERSELKRAHPANSGIHSPVGSERFAPGLPNALMATGGRRAVAGERFDPPFGARLADGIATNSRRFDIHRRSDES